MGISIRIFTIIALHSRILLRFCKGYHAQRDFESLQISQEMAPLPIYVDFQFDEHTVVELNHNRKEQIGKAGSHCAALLKKAV